MKKTLLSFYGVIVSVLVGSVVLTIAVHIVWGDLFVVKEPLHTAIEAFGSILALGVSLIPFNKNQHYRILKQNLLATGFLGMGILNGFHSQLWPWFLSASRLGRRCRQLMFCPVLDTALRIE